MASRKGAWSASVVFGGALLVAAVAYALPLPDRSAAVGWRPPECPDPVEKHRDGRCFAVRGNWDETYQTTLDASLAFSAYFEVVGWNLTRPDDPEAASCVSLVHATTGERLLSGCGEPR